MTTTPTLSSSDATTPAPPLRRIEPLPQGRVRSSATRPALLLGAIVGLSTLVRAVIGLGVPSPWVLPDELLYSELARSIAEATLPSSRGVTELGWGVVYPMLIAPVWAVFDDHARAYDATLVVNALVMSLAAIPAYLLARLVVSRRASLLVALMTVLVPSLSYSGAVLTENAFYPLFLLAVLAIARALRRPTWTAQLAVVLALGLAALTRAQGLALVGAYLGAIVTYSWTSAPSERTTYVRRFVPTAVLVALLGMAPIVASLVSGRGALGWLGARSETFSGFAFHEVPQWFLWLAAGLVLYVAVVPVAATSIVVGRGLTRGGTDAERLFAAVAIPTCAVVLLSVALVSASFDVDGIGNLNERYVFYLVPVTFVGLALWIEARLPRPRPRVWVVTAACCLLPALLPIERLDHNAGLQALALVPWSVLDVPQAVVGLLVGAFALACAAVWLVCPRERAGRLWLLPGTAMVIVGVFVVQSNAVSASRTARAFEGRNAAWVDAAVPLGADVAILWNESTARRGATNAYAFWLMTTEFFNGTIDRVYRIGPPTTYEDTLPTTPVEARADGAVVDARGHSLRQRFVLVTCRTPVEGRVVAIAPRGVLELVETDGPIRLSKRPPCSRSTF